MSWLKIKGYNNYEINKKGQVRNSKTLRVLKSCVLKNNYSCVNLSNKGRVKTFYIHQLMAITFLNHKPSGYNLVVNHIDLNKLNNNIENLEIISHRENCNLKHLKRKRNYTGVYKSNIGFYSQITVKKDTIHLGCFLNEVKAKDIYEKAYKNIFMYNGNKKEFRNLIKTI